MKKKLIVKKSKPVSQELKKPSFSSSLSQEKSSTKQDSEASSAANITASPSKTIEGNDPWKNETVAVEKILQESKQKMQEGQVKRGRGRPPKSASIAGNSQNYTPSPIVSGLNGTANAGAPLQESVKIPKEALNPLIEFPFKAASLSTGFDGWNLDKSETEALSEQLDVVLRQYMPQTASPHGALITFGMTLAMFAGFRYMSYLEWKKTQKVEMIVKAQEKKEEKKEDFSLSSSVNKIIPASEPLGFETFKL